jgi:hypothetical protein
LSTARRVDAVTIPYLMSSGGQAVGSANAAAPVPAKLSAPALSDGEVNFLWWFMQGSIMDLEVRRALWDGWGLCERHAIGWLTVEAAFRRRYLHGPAIVYAELIARAREALAVRGWPSRRLRTRLRTKARCHLCALGYGPNSGGYAPPARMQAGRDPANLRAFLRECRPSWRPYVCGHCAGDERRTLCRVHLIESLATLSDAELAGQRRSIDTIAQGAARYESSYRWELRGTDTTVDRGAFVAAVGWCSGWGGLLGVAAGRPPFGG